MNNPLDKVYLSQTNLESIANGGSITSGDDSFSADENTLYLVPDDDSGGGSNNFYLHTIQITFVDEDEEYSLGDYYIDIDYISTSPLLVGNASDLVSQYNKSISLKQCTYTDDVNETFGYAFLLNLNLFPVPEQVELVIHLVGVNYDKYISTLPNTFTINSQNVTEL